MSKNLLKAWHRFMQTSFNSFKGAPSDLHKTRKYEHIEVQKDFEEIEKKRHLQRLTLIEYKKKLRKQLLEQQLEAAKTQAPELLADKKLAEELKHAQDMKKYGEHKTFQDFSKNLEDSKRQLTEQKAAATAAASAQELQKELAKISADIDKIRSTKQELEKVEQEIEELEPNYVLVSGIEKKLVLNAITYYEFQHRNLQGVLINPETIKALETVHYHVEHNLPVRRELLYEVVPELFEVEIGELDQYERERILAKRPRLQHSADAIIRAVEDPPEDRKNLEDFEEYKKQEMDFMEFVYAKAGEFINKHHDHIENKMALGFPTTESVLENIEGKPAEERSEEERALYDDLQEIKVLNNDYAELIKLNKAKIFAKQRELHVPEFVKQNERLHSMWVEKWEQLVASSFEFSESLFLPDNSRTFESQLDKVLKQQQAQDINDLISQSQEEYKTRVGAKEATRSIDRNVKNMQLLQKLDVMTGAMHQVEERKKVKQRELDHFQTTLGQAETPEEGRILLDELTKVLFLNNRDPKSYNLMFWAEHFNIEPQKLRNIFNFVTFGLPDKNNPKDIGRVLRFIYDNSALTDEQKQQLA